MLTVARGEHSRRVSAWRRLGRSRRGTTAVETAILLPLMLAFLLGIEELGRLLWTQSVLQYACERAARCAAIAYADCSTGSPSTPTQATVSAYASSKAFALNVPAADFTFDAAGSPGSACGGPQVTASYTFQPLVPGLVPGLAVTLNGKSCLPQP